MMGMCTSYREGYRFLQHHFSDVARKVLIRWCVSLVVPVALLVATILGPDLSGPDSWVAIAAFLLLGVAVVPPMRLLLTGIWGQKYCAVFLGLTALFPLWGALFGLLMCYFAFFAPLVYSTFWGFALAEQLGRRSLLPACCLSGIIAFATLAAGVALSGTTDTYWPAAAAASALVWHLITVPLLLIASGRVLAHLDATSHLCTVCGYDQRGLTTPVCPECGASRASTATEPRPPHNAPS